MKPTFFALLWGLVCPFVWGQEKSAVSKLLETPKLKTIPLEQDLFLHVNQNRFFSGDTIWFRGYALQGPFQQSSSLSSSLTVALVNQSKKDIKNTQFMMFEGKAEGQLILPESLASGYYQLVAYTSNMLNYDWEHFYRIPIEVTKKRPSDYNITYSLDKSGYSIGDTVEVKLHNFDKSLQDISKKRLRCAYFKEGEGVETWRTQTDEFGDATVRFPYQFDEDSTDLSLVQLKVRNAVAEDEDASFIHIPSKQSLSDIQILPEGGELIAGIGQVVGFRAVDYRGSPIAIKGVINDDLGNEVIDFTTLSEGMGKIILVAEKGRSYTMEVTSPEEYKQTVPFPKVRDSGVSLSLQNISKGVATFTVRTTSNDVKELTSVFQMDGIILATTAFEFQKERSFKMDITTLPLGIAKFTIFENNGEPLAERLIFVDNDKPNNIALSMENQRVLSRENISIDLDGSTLLDSLKTTALSLTVTHVNNGINKQYPLPDIRNFSILKPELRASVYHPEQYFDNSSNKRSLAFKRDLLMLTHGWRTFRWFDNVKKRADSTYLVYNYDRYVGRVTKGKKPVANAKLNVFPFPNSFEIMNFEADEEGRFSFLARFESKANPTLVFHAERKNKLSRTSLKINDRERDMRDTIITAFAHEIAPLNYSRNTNRVERKEKQDSIFKLWDTEYLDEVVVTADKNIDEVDEFLRSNGFGFGLSRIFDPTEFGDYALGMDNIVYNMGGGLFIENDTLYRRKYGKKVAIPIYLDEMPIGTEYFQISHFTSDMISRAIFAEGQGFMAGSMGDDYSAGVFMVWIDKNAKSKDTKLNRNSYISKRYEDSRVFYTPKYETKIEKTLPIQDERVTLHWENNIVLDSLGHASVSFYTGDLKGEYLINLQGVTENNGLVFEEETFEVY